MTFLIHRHHMFMVYMCMYMACDIGTTKGMSYMLATWRGPLAAAWPLRCPNRARRRRR